MKVSVLIPVTKNEAPCLPNTLESVRKDMESINGKCEIIVIANACKGTSDVVADEVFAKDEFKTEDIVCKVIYCETPGKMFAVNSGIDDATGEVLVLIDGDLVLDPGSLLWTIDALDMPDIVMTSMHHSPIESELPDNNELSLVIQMNALRRHAFPEKYWLHGAYLGWKKDFTLEGEIMRFPEGTRVHEDNWLAAMISKEYGFKAMRVTKNYMARFISPQTWEDYYRQQWRYQFAHEDLANEFPDLAEYIPEIRKWTNEKYPETWIDREWRESCIRQGIDFDGFHSFYFDVLEKVRAGRENAGKLLDENGVWVQQITTKGTEK